MTIRITRFTVPFAYVRVEEVKPPPPAPVTEDFTSVEAALAQLPANDPAREYLQKFRKENPGKGTEPSLESGDVGMFTKVLQFIGVK